MPEERVLTPKEAAAKMATSISTIYRLIQEGALPVAKIRGSYRIKLSDLAAYIERSGRF